LLQSIRESANSSKKHNGFHELESIEGCPEDGRGGSHKRGYGFGDVREEKSSKYVTTKAKDKRNESDVAARATRVSNQPPTAGKKTRLGRVRATSPVRTCAIRLSTSRRQADSDESGGDGSSKCKEARGAQDIISHNTDNNEEEDEDNDKDEG